MGTPSASHACAIPSIACASSQPISGLSGFPKLRQSVSASGSPPPPPPRAAPPRPRERLAAGAGDVSSGTEHCLRAGGEGVELADRRPVERDGETAVRGQQTEDG